MVWQSDIFLAASIKPNNKHMNKTQTFCGLQKGSVFSHHKQVRSMWAVYHQGLNIFSLSSPPSPAQGLGNSCCQNVTCISRYYVWIQCRERECHTNWIYPIKSEKKKVSPKPEQIHLRLFRSNCATCLFLEVKDFGTIATLNNVSYPRKNQLKPYTIGWWGSGLAGGAKGEVEGLNGGRGGGGTGHIYIFNKKDFFLKHYIIPF